MFFFLTGNLPIAVVLAANFTLLHAYRRMRRVRLPHPKRSRPPHHPPLRDMGWKWSIQDLLTPSVRQRDKRAQAFENFQREKWDLSSFPTYLDTKQ
ncbi:hypothetical protein IMZ48_46035 [Candidatus Bathyarchaeota archaeon]|nr:hypothetical protein [Candidatus Bathyarchaeota archaeon]